MTMEEIRTAAAQKRAEERAQAQQQLQKLDAGRDIGAEPEIATVVAAEPAPQPEPVAAAVPVPPQEPIAPEILSTTVEFTNQDLLEFLKIRADLPITTGHLSQHFKITFPLAAEIINDLKREKCIGEDNKVVPLANIEAIESTLREAEALSSKFIHIPPEVETPAVAPDQTVDTPPKTIEQILSEGQVRDWLFHSKYPLDQTPEESAGFTLSYTLERCKSWPELVDTVTREISQIEKELQNFNEYMQAARNADSKTDASLDTDQRNTFHNFLNAESQIRSYLEHRREEYRVIFEKTSRLTPEKFLEMKLMAASAGPTIDFNLDPHTPTSPDIDLNLDEPAPATNTTTTSVDINIDDLKAVPAPATPAADPSAAPTAPAPIARASTMTERLFGTKTKRALVAGAFFLGIAGIYALKSTKSPDAAPAPAAEKAKPAPKAEGQKPAAERAAQAQQQNKQEASVVITKEQLLAAKLPEQIQESVIKIMAQPNVKDFITPFLKQAKKHQTEQLVQLTDPVINKIFGILNDTENAHLLNTAWSGKTGLTMSECLVEVNNTTCDIRANFSLIAKIYREILQETSGFSRLHDAQLPEKTITEMHAYVRAEIQKYLAKQAAAK